MQSLVSQWSTPNVWIELLSTDSTELTIRRTRGRRQREKQVMFSSRDARNLMKGLREALSNRPTSIASVRTIVCIVPSRYGNLSIGWEPYWYGEDDALVIRQRCAVAIESADAVEFAAWLTECLDAVLLPPTA